MNFKKLAGEYEIFKKYIFNGSEVKCIELNNYYIDNNTTNELTVDFLENFNKPPHIFMSFNGFLYKPHLGLNDGLR